MIVGRCHYCREPVDDAVQTAARRIVGWEPLRKGKGGQNRVVGRTVLDGYVAHTTCAERVAKHRRQGISDGQEVLL